MERTTFNKGVLMGLVLATLCVFNIAAWRESLDITNLNVKNNLVVSNNATVSGTIAVTGAATLGSIDGESISDDTIDDDSIDFGDVTGADLTLTDCGSVFGSRFDILGSSVTSRISTAAGYLDGEAIADDTIDDDSIDFGDVTFEDLSGDPTATDTITVTDLPAGSAAVLVVDANATGAKTNNFLELGSSITITADGGGGLIETNTSAAAEYGLRCQINGATYFILLEKE